jgi:hypothetical protein
MHDEPIPPFNRVMAFVLAERWDDAQTMIASEGLPTTWAMLVRGMRLSKRGEAGQALRVFTRLRLECENAIVAEGRKPDEDVFKLLVESCELGTAVDHGLYPPSAGPRVRAKLGEVYRRLQQHDHELILAKMTRNERWKDVPPVFRRLVEVSPELTAVLGFASIVEASPDLLRQPTLLHELGIRGLSAAVHANPEAADPFRRLVKTRRDLRRVIREVHTENTRQLIASPSLRALQVRMFDAWRRGCTAERYTEIGESHIRGEQRMRDFLDFGRSTYEDSVSKSDEERIRSLCESFRLIAESVYKEALRAMVRIEWGRDDLDRIPNMVGVLINQLRSHPAWRVSDRLLSLVDPEIAFIRNAISHRGDVMVNTREIEFINKPTNGPETRLGPMNADEVERRLERLVESWTTIVNAFNYIIPPQCMHPIRRSLPILYSQRP